MAKTDRGKSDKPGRSAHRSEGSPWSAQIGRCRALRIGSHVWVTGASAVRADGRVYGRRAPQAQTDRCLDVIEEALRRVDADMGHVVRTSVFLTDIRCWEAVERAIQARFPERPVANTIVEVSALTHPDTVVEIEAEAFLPDAAQ
jgi:enamine deaminase RidA (YjgF/YER057c/UK114 family)